MRKNLLNSYLIAALLCSCSFANAQTPRLQLFEYFDDDNLPFGAVANRYFDALEKANTGKMISIKYHIQPLTGNDSMNLENQGQNQLREYFYNVQEIPEVIQDGGATTKRLFSGVPDTLFQSKIDARSAMLSPFKISVSHALNATHDSILTHTVIIKTGTLTASLAAQVIVIERTIHYNTAPGLSGDVNFENVMKEMLTAVPFNSIILSAMNVGDSIVLDLPWKLANVHDTSQLAVVSFVQDNTTLEVYQAGYSAPFARLNDAGILSVNADGQPFTGVPQFTCDSISAVAVLHNGGSNTLTTCNINSQLDNATPSVFSWSGSLLPDSSINVTLPAFFAGGFHFLKVFSSNPNGNTDSEHYNDTTFTFFSEASVPAQPPLSQNFEGAFPPANWGIGISDFLYTWQQAAAGGFGLSNSSAVLPFYGIPAGTINDFYVPAIDLGANSNPVHCTFSVAYARFDAFNFDSLEVRVSTDCGTSWTTAYSKASTFLATAPDDDTLAGPFVPTNSQWRHDTIDLTPFNGQSDVLIQFHGISGFGNDLYIDDININVVTGINSYTLANQFDVFPNPSTGNFIISSGYLIKNGIIEIYNSVGEKVLEEAMSGTATKEVNLKNAPSGVYFLRMHDGESERTRKIIVQRD